MRPSTLLIPLLLTLSVTSLDVVRAQGVNGSGNAIGARPGFQAAIHAGVQVPSGDLARRFGVSNSVGLSAYRMDSHGWRWGCHYRFQTGADVREPGLLDNLRDPNGYLIDNEGRIALVTAQQRGTLLFLTGDRLLPTGFLHSGSALFVGLGLGFWEHRIHFQNRGNRLTQLEEPHVMGYDRLTGGAVVIPRAGVMHDAPNGLVRFECGVEFAMGRLQPNRAWNTDTMSSDEGPRRDGAFGLFAAWILRLQARSTAVDYYH